MPYRQEHATTRRAGGTRQHVPGMLPPSKLQIETCLIPATSAALWTSARIGLVNSQGPLGSSQLTSEKKPRFSGNYEALAIPVVALSLR